MGITMILSLLSGVALFLFGMGLMGDSLKKVAGNKLELILYRLTNTPIKGLLLGMVVTAIIQSSSATTVMVVGFVNSGMMKVAQAIGIIMGANIGTSITGWILCLSYIDGSSGIAQLLSTATISAIVAIIGIIFKMFIKKKPYCDIGDIMLGFAILMVGMQTMSGAVSPLKENPHFVSLLTMFKNPFMGILVGIAFTAVLQSASAAVGILQALSITGSITFAVALPITMGIGVGAACPVLLSSIGTNKNGKRTALIYLLNDLFGMIFWSIVFYSVNAVVHFSFMDITMTPVRVALMNSVFRILTILVLAPFIGKIEKLVFFLIKDTPEDDEEQADVLAPGQILHAQRVSHKIDHDHRVDGADDGVLDAVHKTGEQRTVCKHSLIALQGKLAGQQEGLAGVHIVGIRKGRHQNVVQRVSHNEHDGGADDYQNDVADLIGQTAGLLLTGCCNVFCHNGSPPLHKADVCRLLGDAVDDDEQDDVDHRVEQTHSGGIAVLGVDDALFVDVHGNDIAGGLVQLGLQQQHLFKAHVHQVAYAHNELQNDHGYQFRNVDVQNALEHGRAIDLSGFVQAGIHSSQTSHINDGTPSGFLPDAGGDIDGTECGTLGEEIHAGAQDQVQQTAGRTEENFDHTTDDHGRDEVGGVQHRLHHPLEFCKA